MTEQYLFDWHAALFSTGRSGVTRITTGSWRTPAEAIQIVTPGIGKPDVVHYEAPPRIGSVDEHFGYRAQPQKRDLSFFLSRSTILMPQLAQVGRQYSPS